MKIHRVCDSALRQWGVGAVLLLAALLLVGGGHVQGQVPRAAKAEAAIEEGYVVELTLTDPGAGYGVAPSVTLIGGGGSGATAVALVRSGWVDQLRLVTTGSGYTSTPTVVIAEPADPMIESADLCFGMTISGQLGETHRILAKDDLAPIKDWQERARVVVSASPYAWVDEAAWSGGFYRVAGVTQPPIIQSAQVRSRLTIRGTVGMTNWILGTELANPHVWRVLAGVVVPSSVYDWVDQEAHTSERWYQVAAEPTVPLEMDSRRWVWIQPGRFIMGSPTTERGRSSVEGPQTVVTLTRGFWLGKYEVTQREYLAVMGENPSLFASDLNRPVESVRWYDATNYCGKLAAQERAAGRLPTGYDFRLPTEAQWEYACRAGTTTRYSFGDALECDDRCAACSVAARYMCWCGSPGDQGYPVGRKLPNPWGLYDMHGNVYEWCHDRWMNFLPGGTVVDPVGPDSGSDRLIRGGSWYDQGQYCRSAARGGNWPGIGANLLGFRVALVQVP
ncbi:MAG: formylglycine-generating enzyme family protein [Verrucomicrobia bacterium]|jgi:formylglycine-generating enzyme required for sulfatase activity|nr:formylglycine-generating enzyme family protein [Verrucomicrobiota bacterium]OQC67567.1 MAG: Serine/threonine-protein kinase pkn1 [Verrucomicrobia bacterium ADurb.Bin006]MDI9382548.1 formylglycine-generating enzyme family protein [Verrucomicrobiota bacterium]NMD18671.1 formylglycine-generating enzyme family protein [Verrucomicrobiota bacterium]HOA60875.1 formylglycine-generating enzyme family protein [Verrucomicrobiota bacterium]